MDTSVRNGLLYEVYGFMLTETQRELCEAYYYEDLSLSEIAENRSVSKQAVSTQLARAIHKMEQMESRLGVVETELVAEKAVPVLQKLLAEGSGMSIREGREALEALVHALARPMEPEKGERDV